MSQNTVTVSLTQQQDYRFLIDFGAPVPPLVGDEPPPLGVSAGPSPVQLLAASVGNCLSDSLLFALRKFKQAPEPIRTEVTAEVGRNADGRMRVLNIENRIVISFFGQLRQVNIKCRIRRRSCKRISSSVHPYRLNQIFHRHNSPGPL